MKIQKSRSLVHWVLIAYGLYFLQGSLYAEGSIIPQLSLVLILLVDLVYFIRILSSNPSPLTIPITLFATLLTISWIISPKHINAAELSFSTFGELKNTYIFFFSYFPFKYWLSKKIIDLSYVRKTAIFFFIMYVIAYFIAQHKAIVTHSWLENVQNNGGYFLPLVFPLVTLFLNEKKIWIYTGISLLLALISAKRGAIVCMSLEIVIFILFKFRETKNRNLIIFLLLLSVFSYGFYTYVGSNEFLIERFSEDSSGREFLYLGAWKVFLTSDGVHQLMGYGYLQCLNKLGLYVHSDWLELLVDNGIIGVLCYLLIFISLCRLYLKKIKALPHTNRLVYFTAVGCWFIKSIFSMGFTAPEGCVLMIAIAISETNFLLSDNKFQIKKYKYAEL